MSNKAKFTAKDAAEKRKIDRRVLTGKATRKELLRGFDLLRKKRAAEQANA